MDDSRCCCFSNDDHKEIELRCSECNKKTSVVFGAAFSLPSGIGETVVSGICHHCMLKLVEKYQVGVEYVN